MPTTLAAPPFDTRTDALLAQLERDGLYKHLRMLESRWMPPSGSALWQCLCFCSNNYLGLANHPEVVEAGSRGSRSSGPGPRASASSAERSSPHETLEKAIARYMGTQAAYTFVSAWCGLGSLFPTVCESGDIIISDELNHACIIDSIRLSTVIKKGVLKGLYKNNRLEGENSLHEALKAARANPEVTGQIWVVTDGVFSMEGSIADLPAMRRLCDEFGAMLVVDDSHGHGGDGQAGARHARAPGMIAPVGSPPLPLRVDPGRCLHRHARQGVGRWAGGFLAADQR
jgi:glycine C-acetyltransferase